MYRLSFCSIDVINKDIAEVVLNNGVEISLDMVDEFLRFTSVNMSSEVSVLLNKATKYSYKFDALQRLSESHQVANIAVVTYDEVSTANSEYMKQRFNKSHKLIEIFESRAEALEWLIQVTEA